MRVTLLALGCLLILGTVAQAIPVQNGVYNGLYFENSEVWLDSGPRGPDGILSVGDVLWGTLALNGVKGGTDSDGQSGTTIWSIGGGLNPPKEITGYFISQVVGFVDQGGGVGTFIFSTPSSDPNGIISNAELAAGVTLKIYEDDAVDYNTSTQSNAVSTATDGSLLWSLTLGNTGIVNSASADTGYWFSNAVINPFNAPQSQLGDSFAGVNVLVNNSGIAKFGLVNDPNESAFDSDVHIWFNSELSVLQSGLLNNFKVGPNEPMHFFSNDPGVYFPIPEPARDRKSVV